MNSIGKLGGWLAGRDPGYATLCVASQTFFAAIGTFVTMGLIDRFTQQPQSSTVLSVVVTIMASRALRGASARDWGAALLFLPLFIGSVTTLVSLAAGTPWIGPAAFVVTCFTGTFVRRYGDTAARFGRLAVAPLLAALLASPSGHPGQQHVSQAGLTALGCAFAVAFSWFMQRVVLPERPMRELRGALRTLLREGSAMVAASSRRYFTKRGQRRGQRALGRRLTAMRRAAAVADQRLGLFADSPGAIAGRRAALVAAVFDAELAAEEVVTGQGDDQRAGLTAALNLLRRAAGADLTRSLVARPAPPRLTLARPRSRRILVGSTRTAIQLSAALTLAFVVGGLLFSPLSSWVVITAFVVSQGVHSREDVVYKGLRRIGGALTGTVAGTVLAGVTGDRALLTCAAFFLLYAGVALRATSYASWVFCVTSILALLFRIMGFSGTHLLELRLLEIAAGTVCGILPAFLLVPVRASDVARNHAGRALDRLRTMLKDIAHLLQAPAPAPGEDLDGPGPGAAAEGPGKFSTAAEGPGQFSTAAEGPGQFSTAAEGPGKFSTAAEGPGQFSTALLREAARAFDRDIARLRVVTGLPRPWHRLTGARRHRGPGSPEPMLGSCSHAVRSLASAIDRVPADDELSQELRRLIEAVGPNVIAARNRIRRKAVAQLPATTAIDSHFAEFGRRLDIRDTMPASARRGYETSSAALRTIDEMLRQIRA